MTETIKQKHRDIPWIHLLRVLACLMVISLHCSTVARGFTMDELTRHFDVLVSVATKPCVPLFFMITGYLILPYRNGDDVMTFYKKRIPRILFPLLIWGVVYAVLPYFLGMCSQAEMWKELMLSPIKAPNYIGGIMWYLFILIGIYLAIPFLSERIYTNHKMLQLWLCIWFATSVILMIKLSIPDILGQNKWDHNFDLTVYFCGYMGYVLVGYYLSVMPDIKRIFVRWSRWIFLLLVIFINIAMNIKVWPLGMSFLATGTVTLSILMFLLFKGTKIPSKGKIYKVLTDISKMTFGMYLCHMVILRVLTIHLFNIYGAGITIQFLVMLLTAIGAYALSKMIALLPWKKYVIG